MRDGGKYQQFDRKTDSPKPNTGDLFTVITFAAVVGDFVETNGLLQGDQPLTAELLADRLTLEVP